jgi:hypothetical protein
MNLLIFPGLLAVVCTLAFLMIFSPCEHLHDLGRREEGQLWAALDFGHLG